MPDQNYAVKAPRGAFFCADFCVFRVNTVINHSINAVINAVINFIFVIE